MVPSCRRDWRVTEARQGCHPALLLPLICQYQLCKPSLAPPPGTAVCGGQWPREVWQGWLSLGWRAVKRALGSGSYDKTDPRLLLFINLPSQRTSPACKTHLVLSESGDFVRSPPHTPEDYGNFKQHLGRQDCPSPPYSCVITSHIPPTSVKIQLRVNKGPS